MSRTAGLGGRAGTRLERRVAHLEGPLPGGRVPRWVRRLAAELANEAGLDPAAVVREAEEILSQAAAAGVLESLDDLAAFVALASGRAREGILADAQRIVDRW